MTAVLERPEVAAAQDEGTESAAPAVNSMHAKALHTVVSDALNFAAPTALNIPAIATVRIEATDGPAPSRPTAGNATNAERSADEFHRGLDRPRLGPRPLLRMRLPVRGHRDTA